MKFTETEIKGLFIIEDFHVEDERGSFTKTYNRSLFKNNKLKGKFKESFYSVSKRDVIRGMHFQLPPHDQDKMVYVTRGKIIDVILDLRKKSKTYGQVFSIELSEEKRNSLYIPKGCAHGFKSLEDDSTVVYDVTTVHSPESDSGIRWDSFGYDWKTNIPLMSEKDKNLMGFSEFKKKNPF